MYSKAQQTNKNKPSKKKTFGKPKPKSEIKRRQRKCKECKMWFKPERDGQVTCSTQCAIDYAPTLKQKQHRKALKAQSDTSIAKWKRSAKEETHKHIRHRDKNKPCVSCGEYFSEANPIQAGHYYSDGGHAMLRYDEDNIHGQCLRCNVHMSGNLKNYRVGLLKRIGKDRLERLDSLAKKPKKRTIQDYKEIVIYYKAKGTECKKK